MDIINDVASIVGYFGAALGVGLPFLSPATTTKVGKAFGSLGKRILGQRLDAARRFSRTAEDFIEGFRDGLK